MGRAGPDPGETVAESLFASDDEAQDGRVRERALAEESFSTSRSTQGRLVRTMFDPVHGASGALEGVIGVATDVTEHQRARHEMLRFKALADSSHNLIAIATTDGTAAYLNPRVIGLGLPAAGGDVWRTTADLVGDGVVAEMRREVESNGRWSGDLLVQGLGGVSVVATQVFPLADADTGEVLGTACIAQDISELRATEEALRAMNEDLVKFRALVETSSDFIAIAGLDGAVRYLNPAGRALVGMMERDVSQTTISDYLTRDRRRRGSRRWCAVRRPTSPGRRGQLGEPGRLSPAGPAPPVRLSPARPEPGQPRQTTRVSSGTPV